MDGGVRCITRPWPSARRLGPGSRSQGRSAGAGGCTTRRQNSHGTAAHGEIAYAWHPWAGQAVRVHEVIERATGAQVRCSLAGDRVARAQQIPAWMLDAAFCAAMRRTSHPVTELSALTALQALLLAVVAARVSAAEGRHPTVASPDQDRGDRHGSTPPPPGPGTGSSARPPRPETAVGAQRDAGLELVATTDAAHADRLDDAPAGRACRPRRAIGGAAPMSSEKIGPQHLARKAVLYVRQSSTHQVLHNRESQA